MKKILNYIYKEDAEILSQKSEKVTDVKAEAETIAKMLDAIIDVPDAAGLSAIQIGIPKRICLCRWGGKTLIMINPEITRTRGEQEFVEGCLSFPYAYTKVKRHQKVWCKYLNPDGEECEIAEGGRMSDIIQHELDHFEGKCAVYEAAAANLSKDIKGK